MTWISPRPSEAQVEGYVIEWSKDDEEQEPIILNLVNEYTFANLLLNQSVTATVCTITEASLFEEIQITGLCSRKKRAIVLDIQGVYIAYFELNLK